MKHGNPSVTSKVVEAGMGRKRPLWGLLSSKTAACVLRPSGHPVAVQSPEQPQSRWILHLEEFCILRGRNSLRRTALVFERASVTVWVSIEFFPVSGLPQTPIQLGLASACFLLGMDFTVGHVCQ